MRLVAICCDAEVAALAHRSEITVVDAPSRACLGISWARRCNAFAWQGEDIDTPLDEHERLLERASGRAAAARQRNRPGPCRRV